MNTPPSAGPLGEAPTSDELDLGESAAGEEDPGAALDLPPTPEECYIANSVTTEVRCMPVYPAT